MQEDRCKQFPPRANGTDATGSSTGHADAIVNCAGGDGSIQAPSQPKRTSLVLGIPEPELSEPSSSSSNASRQTWTDNPHEVLLCETRSQELFSAESYDGSAGKSVIHRMAGAEDATIPPWLRTDQPSADDTRAADAGVSSPHRGGLGVGGSHADSASMPMSRADSAEVTITPGLRTAHGFGAFAAGTPNAGLPTTGAYRVICDGEQRGFALWPFGWFRSVPLMLLVLVARRSNSHGRVATSGPSATVASAPALCGS